MTFTPLFSWRELLEGIFLPQRRSFEDMTSHWLRGEEKSIWLSRSMWSLTCIVKLRKLVNANKSTIVVWAPDFFCNGSLSKIREEGIKLIFYPINEDLSPNLEACECIVKNNEDVPDMVIATHYFGSAVDVKGIARLCKKYGSWLIEDAAHILTPIAGVGEFGDFVCYSPHKFLSIPDGAILVIRAKGISQLQLDGSVCNFLDSIVSSLPSNFLERISHVSFWILKRIAQKIGFKKIRITDNFYVDDVGLGIQYSDMSLFSKKMLAICEGDLHKTALDRQQMMEKFDTLFLLSSFKENFEKNTDREKILAPYLSSYKFKNYCNINSIFNKLEILGLPVSSWPDLPPEILENPTEHAVAIAHRNNHFYISPHQSISNSQLKSIFKKIAQLDNSGFHMIELNEAKWRDYWKISINPSLLQSWEYGSAIDACGLWSCRRFLVCNDQGKAVAIAQMMVLKLPLFGSFAYLNQGPIFLINSCQVKDAKNLQLVANTISTLFSQSNKFGFRLLHISPKIIDSQADEFLLELLNLKKLGWRRPWSSATLSLNKTTDELMSGLTSSWRGHLRKSQQLGVLIQSHNLSFETINFLINQYKQFQKNRKFIGISENLIRSLALQSKEHSDWRFNFFTAHMSNKLDLNDSIGLLVTIEFHDTAIYLIGFTNEVGRTAQANYALLWSAILQAKEKKLMYFDLGGVREDTQKGISDFKYSTGAAPYSLVGEWRSTMFGI